MAKCEVELRAWQRAKASGASPQALKAARDAYRQCMKDSRGKGTRRGTAKAKLGRSHPPGVTPIFCSAIKRAADNLDRIAASLRQTAANLIANGGGDPQVAKLAYSLEKGADLHEGRAKALRARAKKLGCRG
jgi:hypothetical protein